MVFAHTKEIFDYSLAFRLFYIVCDGHVLTYTKEVLVVLCARCTI